MAPGPVSCRLRVYSSVADIVRERRELSPALASYHDFKTRCFMAGGASEVRPGGASSKRHRCLHAPRAGRLEGRQDLVPCSALRSSHAMLSAVASESGESPSALSQQGGRAEEPGPHTSKVLDCLCCRVSGQPPLPVRIDMRERAGPLVPCQRLPEAQRQGGFLSLRGRPVGCGCFASRVLTRGHSSSSRFRGCSLPKRKQSEAIAA